MPSPIRPSFISMLSPVFLNTSAERMAASRVPSGIPTLVAVGLTASGLYHGGVDATFGRHPDIRAGFIRPRGGYLDTLGGEATAGVLSYAAARWLAATHNTRLRPGIIGLAVCCGVSIGLGYRDGTCLRSDYEGGCIIAPPPRYLMSGEAGRRLGWRPDGVGGACTEIVRPDIAASRRVSEMSLDGRQRPAVVR